jgi:hypothetical protein
MPTYEIGIGDVVLDPAAVYDFTYETKPVGHGIETTGVVTLRLDAVDPSKIDLYEPVIVDEIGATRNRVLWGVIVNALDVNDKKLALSLEGPERYHKEWQVGYRSFSNFSPQEIVFYLSRRIPEIEVQEKNIVGLKLNKNRRVFRVIFPVLNFEISDEVRVLGQRLGPVEASSDDERQIQKYSNEELRGAPTEQHIWSETRVRAQMSIEATYFDEAALEGRRLATAIVDLISYMVRLSTLGLKSDDGSVVTVPWDRNRYFTLPQLGHHAYVRDLSEATLKSCIIDFRSIRGETKLSLSRAEVGEYSRIMTVFENLTGVSTDESRRLSWSIHWLRRAKEASDSRDRLIDLWIALEFLTTGTRVPEICSSSQLDALERVIRQEAHRLGVGNVEDLAQRFRAAVNNPTLFDRFAALTSAVPITDSERKTVWDDLRGDRNDLQHGRRFDVEPRDLDVMERMLSKMIWILANRIIFNKTMIPK